MYGCLNDVIANLNRTGQAGELKSTTVVEISLAKLLRDLSYLWGEDITRNYQATSLVSLKDWLEIKLMGHRLGDNKLAHSEQRMGNGFSWWAAPRRVQSNAMKSTLGICVICKGKHSVQECPTFRKGDCHKRSALAKEPRLCYGYLRNGHGL